MSHRRLAMVWVLVWAVSACHSMPQKEQPANAPEDNTARVETPAPAPDSNAALPSTETPTPAEIPPCVPAENTSKPAPKRKPKPVARAAPPPREPPAAPPPTPSGEADVKLMPAASASILGKKVRGQEGDDLGRLVDVLADAQGRVRIAVIEFGGFLGVGNRRIAVDWSLLKFHPEDPDAPLVLDVAKRKLQRTPEYKGSERPLVLMAPEAPASPQSTAPK